jgi:hypothetical protein
MNNFYASANLFSFLSKKSFYPLIIRGDFFLAVERFKGKMERR